MSFLATLPGIALLTTVGIAAALWLCVIRMRGPEDTFFVGFIRVVATVYVRCVHRLRVVAAAPHPVPSEGPVIVVANHRSGVDPITLAVATRRKVRFLMAREYYEACGMSWLFRRLGCIPVNRDGNDLGATKAAIRALRAGQVIGIFPQGGIRDPGASLEGKGGAALLALKTRAPVVPVSIHGSPNLESVFLALLTPSKTTISFGQPLGFAPTSGKPSREEIGGVTQSILDAIASLAEESEATPAAPNAKAL